MKTETLHPVTDYVQESFNFIAPQEGFRRGLPYFDTANPPRATIGYGFNIEVPDYLLLVLREMGIVNGTMTTTEINTIRNAFTTEINKTPHADIALQINLDRIYGQYGGTGSFLINRTQGGNIIRDIILGLNIQTTDGNIVVQGKEARLDALLRDPITGQSTLAHNSKEYVAVMSLFYTAESLVDSTKKLLANAIINDNRAEAWYEIRYNSNADNQHTARRYREANQFNLYDIGPLTTDESKEIMRMYTIHQLQETNPSKKMSSYEDTHTHKPSSTIMQEIQPARNYLVDNFAMGNTIDGEVVVGKGLITYDYSNYDNGYYNDNNLEWNYDAVRNDLIFGERGNDELYGFAGNDVIYGGEGNDILIGGVGNDTLVGGENNDTYIINYGEGTDTIIDTQGRNKIIYKDINGKERIIDNFYTSSSGSNITADGKATLTHNSPWQIIFDDGTVIELGEGCTPENFGIDLIDLPANPGIDNTILGDQNSGELVDWMSDTSLNDRIISGVGNDLVWCGGGGENWVLGGDGYDIRKESGLI